LAERAGPATIAASLPAGGRRTYKTSLMHTIEKKAVTDGTSRRYFRPLPFSVPTLDDSMS